MPLKAMKFLQTWKEPPKSRLVKSLTNPLLNSFHVNYQIYNFCQTTVNIRESVTIFHTGEKGRPRVEVELEEMDETEKKLFEVVEKKWLFTDYGAGR